MNLNVQSLQFGSSFACRPLDPFARLSSRTHRKRSRHFIHVDTLKFALVASLRPPNVYAVYAAVSLRYLRGTHVSATPTDSVSLSLLLSVSISHSAVIDVLLRKINLRLIEVIKNF